MWLIARCEHGYRNGGLHGGWGVFYCISWTWEERAPCNGMDGGLHAVRLDNW
jgi:hypothetical protein